MTNGQDCNHKFRIYHLTNVLLHHGYLDDFADHYCGNHVCDYPEDHEDHDDHDDDFEEQR